MSHCVADNAELMKKYQELKYEMNRLNQDFELLYKIGGLIASLSKPYRVSDVVYSDVYSSWFFATEVAEVREHSELLPHSSEKVRGEPRAD